jgi:hypothetical protein
LNESLQHDINGFLIENSTIAPNRLVKIKSLDQNEEKISLPARYLADNISEMYRSYVKKDQLSFSCFYKHVKKISNLKSQFASVTCVIIVNELELLRKESKLILQIILILITVMSLMPQN